MKKRGQVTAFIIVGILVLLGIVLYLYLEEDVNPETPEEFAQKVSTALEPVQNYVIGCVKLVAQDGLEELGKHGGYIETDALDADPVVPTRGNALGIDSQNGPKVAYWWHMKSQYEYYSQRPALRKTETAVSSADMSVEAQLERYIEANIDQCLLDFDAFPGFDVARIRKPEATVTIGFEDIGIGLNYPLDVRYKEDGEVIKSEQISKFYTIVNLNLEKVFRLADDIVDFEKSNFFLEKSTMNIVSAFSAIDRDKLPAVGGGRLDYGVGEFWLRSKVQEQMETLLSIYTNALSVVSTKNFKMFYDEDPLKAALYRGFIIPIGVDFDDPENSVRPYRDYKVNFMYVPKWPIYLDIESRGGSGELIRPGILSIPFMSFLPSVKSYRNYYDISYPVLIEVEDSTAFNNKGYTFQFAIETNVIDNNLQQVDLSLVDYGEPVDERSQLCDFDQRNSGEIEFSATDSESGQPLDDVVIYYSCGPETCIVDATENGKLTTLLPVCIGGQVTASKPDYLAESVDLNTYLGEGAQVDIDMDRVHELDVELRKMRMVPRFMGDDKKWVIDKTIRPIDPKEFAVVRIEKQKESDFEEDLSSIFILHGDGKTEPEDAKARLVPGKYTVDIDMFLEDTVYIPEDEICEGVGLLKQCETMQEVRFDQYFPRSGVTFEWIVNDDVYDKDKLTLFTISSPDGFDIGANGKADLVHSDLKMIGDKEKRSEEYADLLEPVLR